MQNFDSHCNKREKILRQLTVIMNRPNKDQVFDWPSGRCQEKVVHIRTAARQASVRPTPNPYSPTGHPKRQLEGNHTGGYRVMCFEKIGDINAD